MSPNPSSALIRNVASLQQQLASGCQVKYLFFWGHTPAPRATTDGKECLSQWYPAAFTTDDRTYATAEHYMMAEKARLFGDEAIRVAIIAVSHPDQAKKLGREVPDFDSDVWDAARFDIVVRGNEAKFGQHPALR